MAGQEGLVAFFQIDEAIGDRQQGQGIGGDEMFSATHANDQRATHAGAQQLIGVISMHDADGIGTFEFGQGGTEGRKERSLTGCRGKAIVGIEEVGDDFRVGIGVEAVSLALQAALQCFEVFDDAVMHHCHARTGKMRVGIRMAGLAMGGPASVSDAQPAIESAIF